jgi:hypothetical protein
MHNHPSLSSAAAKAKVVSASAAAATSSAGNTFAKATDEAPDVATWSHSDLKQYLSSRGITVLRGITHGQLVAAVHRLAAPVVSFSA